MGECASTVPPSRSDGLSVFLVDLREAKGKGVEIRKIDAMINHHIEHRNILIYLTGFKPEALIIAHRSRTVFHEWHVGSILELTSPGSAKQNTVVLMFRLGVETRLRW